MLKQKSYYAIASSLFLVVAILHAVRAFMGWDMNIEGYVIPVWLSWVAAALTGYLAFRGFRVLCK